MKPTRPARTVLIATMVLAVLAALVACAGPTRHDRQPYRPAAAKTLTDVRPHVAKTLNDAIAGAASGPVRLLTGRYTPPRAASLRPQQRPTITPIRVQGRVGDAQNPTVGEVLVTTNGTWTNSPTGFAYQWQHCGGSCSNIGTNANSYTIVSSDVGDTIQVTVTASNAQGSAAKTSAPTGVVTSGSSGSGTWNGTAETGLATTTCNLYASPSGNDTTGTGSSSSPYLTPSKLDTSLTAGQTGCLRAGTYGSSSSSWTLSNSAGVTLTGYPGEAAQIDGAVTITGAGTTISYLNVDENNQGNTTGHCNIGTPSDYSTRVDANNVTLTHSNFFSDTATAKYKAVGIGVGWGDNLTGGTISYNRIHDFGFCLVEDHGIYLDGIANEQVTGNWIYGNQAGTGIELYASSLPGPTNANVTGNVFADDESCLTLGGNDNSTANNTIQHNVCVDEHGYQSPYTASCGQAGTPGSGYGQTYCTGWSTTDVHGIPIWTFWGGTAGSGNSYSNNDDYCTSTTFCSTSLLGSTTGLTTSGNVTTNPAFADATYATDHDYRVTGSSPAASWGIWDGDIATSQVLNCFNSPMACGYPDPAAAVGNASHVGPNAACSSLTTSGSVTASTNGQTVSNLNITGTLTINAPNVTVNNVCVTDPGGNQISASAVLVTGSGTTNTLIENSTISGQDNGTSGQSVERAVTNDPNTGGTPVTLQHDYIYNCGECIHDGGITTTDTYAISNGMQTTSDHVEVGYYGNGGAQTYNHDVLLNPWPQTAVVYADDLAGASGACAGGFTITNSLLGGGEMPFWACFGTSVGSWTMDIENNNFVTCAHAPYTQLSDGGWICGSNTGGWTSWSNVPIGTGADTHGYWPIVGYEWITNMGFCANGSSGPPGTTTGQLKWSNNESDVDGRTYGCPNPFSGGSQAGGANDTAKPDVYSAPVVAGTDTVGQALTLTQGAWLNTPTLTDQWQDCTSTLSCTNISGATGSSYTLTSADRGSYIRVVETATNGSGSSTPANSGITAAVS